MKIQDIARKAGVSVSTVSRVLNNSSQVSAATKQKVQEIISTEGYVPSAIAQNLVKKNNKTIGLFINDIRNPFFNDLIKGIETVTNMAGYSLIISSVNRSAEKEANSLNMLLQYRACGLIVASCYLQNPENIIKATSYLNVVSVQTNLEGTDQIGVTDRKGTYDIIKYLIGLGHKKIAIMGYDEPYGTDNERYGGYCDAMRDSGISLGSNYVVKVSANKNDCYNATIDLLRGRKRPTAIHCINEYIAYEVYIAIKDLGLRIPEDLSLTGFDNLFLSKLMEPRLTTVSQPITQIGEMAAKIVIDRNENKIKKGTQNIILPTELIIRGSTSVPPSQ